MAINLDDVYVRELFVDSVTSRTTTRVYANGKMQALVFPVAVYEGSIEITEEALKEHVRQYVQIYEISYSGEKIPVDWAYSSTSNGYQHDIDHDVTYSLKDFDRSVRVPFYFTVPVGSTGLHRWIAKYNGHFTPEVAFVTVDSQNFSVSENNYNFFAIDTIEDPYFYHLRSLRYANLPSSTKLVKCAEYQGDKINVGGTIGDCWEVHRDVFFLLEHKATSATKVEENSEYPKISRLGNAFTSEEIKTAWSLGAAVSAFYYHEMSPNIDVEKLKVEDDCGNVTAIDLENWSVKNPVVII